MVLEGFGVKARAALLSGVVLTALLVVGESQAGGFVAANRPAMDPAFAAQLVIAEAAAGQEPRHFALRGRFVGDLNGDGRDELVLPSTTGDSVELFFGVEGLGAGPQQSRAAFGDLQLTLPSCRDADGLLHPVPLGDLDGDGLGDLGLACFEASSLGGLGDQQGAVAIFWGRPGDWPEGPLSPDQLLLGAATAGSPGSYTAGERPGRSVVALGDVNRDGLDDLLVTGEQLAQPEQPIAWLLLGSPLRSDFLDLAGADYVFTGGPDLQCELPLEASALGDVDGGGRADFALICPRQPLPFGGGGNSQDIAYGVFLGESLGAIPPNASLAARDFTVEMFSIQRPVGVMDAALGDLDADGSDEFAVVTVFDDRVTAQVVQGHAQPFATVSPLGPYPGFHYESGEEDPGGLQLAAAGSVVGAGPALWVRIGDEEEARVGFLTEVDPSGWAELTEPPFAAVFSTPSLTEPDPPDRFSMGGKGDFDGDGFDDLLLIGPLADGAGCGEGECFGAWLILCGDLDGDGVSACSGDCNDRDPTVSPVLREQCDELDHDCDGLDGQADEDEDGVAACAGDCADDDPDRFAGAEELCGDGVDSNCDGLSADEDEDGDGTANCEDCQPYLDQVHPAAVEICDGLDSDCDGSLPVDELDIDQDGFRSCESLGQSSDCDDLDPFVRPGRFEDCSNDRDDDCDGEIDEDEDADGDDVSSCQGDCDDARAEVFPGAAELCDGLDNNCNGLIDDARDLDDDGFSSCEGDCDDADPDVHPGLVEQCEAGRDSNCDGLSDFLDNDGDGFTACGGDCDDSAAGISPSSLDWCDRLDNDCDGHVDGPFDGDQDSWATCLGDCDDTEQLRFPQPVEPDCSDAVDGDCDGRSDAGDSDCGLEPESLPPEPRPYGLACADCGSSVVGQRSSAGLWVGLLLFACAGRRRRFPTAVAGRSSTGSPVNWLLLLVAVLVLCQSLPGPAWAARSEPGLVVYLAPQPNIRHMVEARNLLPAVDAVDVLHSSEVFDVDNDGLVVVGASDTGGCGEGGVSTALSAAADAALQQLISFDNLAALKSIEAALNGLACLSAPLPAEVLSRLHYYRAAAERNLGRSDKADLSFERLLAVDPDFAGDPNFPPAVNGRLDELRAGLKGQQSARLLLFSGAREGLRLDGRSLDNAVAAQGLELAAGEHVVQFSRGSTTETALLTLEPGQQAIVLQADERERALREARSDAAARAFVAASLGLAAAEADVSLVVVVDLNEGLNGFEFRPEQDWFSFDEPGAVAGPQRSMRSKLPRSRHSRMFGPSSSAKTRSGGVRTVSGPDVRLRLSGGYLYVHPYSYGQVPVDLTIHIGRGFCIDFGGEYSATGTEADGLISLPAAVLGLSYRLTVQERVQLRLGALARLSVDRQEGAELGALWGVAGRFGGDIIAAGERIVPAFDVQVGMLDRKFYVSGSFGMGLLF